MLQMLAKGEYKIVEILNISKSLDSQIEEIKGSDICKCIVQCGTSLSVAYFIEDVNFGRNTEFELLDDLEVPLVYKENYKVINFYPFKSNPEFITKLIGRNGQ